MLTRLKTLPFFPHPKNNFIDDLLAGLTGAVAGAPQAMAFAIVAGINPVYGLYTAIVSTIVAAIFGSSIFMTVGPTNALALLVGSTLLQYEDNNPLAHMFVLTILVGIFQLIFGLLKLGSITRFVSNAVMTGFVTGAAMLVIMGQLDELTGYSSSSGSRLLLIRTLDWLVNIIKSDPQTTAIGVLAVIIIEGLHHSRLKSVATLTAIVVTGVLVQVVGWEKVELVRDMSTIPDGLPLPILPKLQYAPELWSVAFAAAVLGLIQSAGISRSISQPDGSRADISRDFVGQGLANIASGFFQGMPAGGSLARTAVNISGGAKTRWANVFAGLFVALILIILGDLIEQVVLAALAAHLIVAAKSLISFPQIRMVWQIDIPARLSMGATFLVALLMPLEYSIYVGVGISLAMYAYSSSSNIRIDRLMPLEDGNFQMAMVPAKLPSREPVILAVYGNLYFAAVSTLENLLPKTDDADMPVVIIRIKGNSYLGSTGIRLLERYQQDLAAHGGRLIVVGVSLVVYGHLERTGALNRLGRDNVFVEQPIMLASTRKGLESARLWIAERTEN